MTKLTIAIPQLTALDAGEITETEDAFVIRPPDRPMIDQLIERLDVMPHEFIGIQTRHLGVGLTALCVRWGTYLATLMDESAPLHPDLAAGSRQQPEQFSFITDGEMKRMNIEVSYNLSRLAHVYHERGQENLNDLLSRAYLHLPMPQRTVQMDRELGQSLIASLAAGSRRSSNRPVNVVPQEQADRAIANVLALWGWRNTRIESIHAGAAPSHALRPHQRRMRPRQGSSLLREISGKFASHYFWFDTYFGGAPISPELPGWPETATALANSFLGMQASGWSLTDSSPSVSLRK